MNFDFMALLEPEIFIPFWTFIACGLLMGEAWRIWLNSKGGKK